MRLSAACASIVIVILLVTGVELIANFDLAAWLR